MVDKISELSVDRIFLVLGRAQLPVSPEKIIIYGIFFIGVIIFVNWFLSITVLVLKPFLYTALMLAVFRPEIMEYITTEERMIRFLEMGKSFVTTFSVALMDILQLLFEQFAQRT